MENNFIDTRTQMIISVSNIGEETVISHLNGGLIHLGAILFENNSSTPLTGIGNAIAYWI